ncbi:MAG: alpha/beta hydrolase [Actinomycetota bacterium]|nr:alpha/beta hydrolase [Actinomycetota bacterium]
MTTATVEGAGVELAYDERGEGRPVVLVHGTASTRAIWDEVREALGPGFRTIAYDRRAYGGSGAPEGFTGTTVGEHGDDLIALLRAFDLAPALLCGHSFGAMACLDVIVREPGLVRAAVLIEPPMLWLGSGGSEAASYLRAEIEEGTAQHGAAGAIGAFTRVVCGPDALDIVGYERAKAAVNHPRGFAADLGAVGNWAVAPRDLRAIATPVVMVAGTNTPPAYREPALVLAEMIPSAELRECESGHLVPNEAPGVVADAIRAIAQP